MTRFTKIYPSTLDAGNQALDDVLGVMEDGLVEESLRRAVTLAVSEVFTNAVVHGNGGDPEKTVRLELVINETRICADITDQGQGGLRRIKARKLALDSDEGGRGIDLIAHFADACRFSEPDVGGLMVSLEFSRENNATVCSE